VYEKHVLFLIHHLMQYKHDTDFTRVSLSTYSSDEIFIYWLFAGRKTQKKSSPFSLLCHVL